MPKPELEFFDPTERLEWTPVAGAERLEDRKSVV